MVRSGVVAEAMAAVNLASGTPSSSTTTRAPEGFWALNASSTFGPGDLLGAARPGAVPVPHGHPGEAPRRAAARCSPGRAQPPSAAAASGRARGIGRRRSRARLVHRAGAGVFQVGASITCHLRRAGVRRGPPAAPAPAWRAPSIVCYRRIVNNLTLGAWRDGGRGGGGRRGRRARSRRRGAGRPADRPAHRESADRGRGAPAHPRRRAATGPAAERGGGGGRPGGQPRPRPRGLLAARRRGAARLPAQPRRLRLAPHAGRPGRAVARPGGDRGHGPAPGGRSRRRRRAGRPPGARRGGDGRRRPAADHPGAARLDGRFHAAIVAACGNARLRHLWATTHPAVWVAGLPALFSLYEQPMARSHRDLWATIERASPETPGTRRRP